ncbi:MAG: ABC transporter [Firmicutes bacterium HGW-Firmicutes-1]|jgi:iron complex transport system ATP-binding protein|nr:MAG: ABC transporter [Firmicutes bacterium HGW-Firmicutes-1]
MSISIEQLEHFYDHRKILKDITHEFEKGRFYGIIGPNGSGKTTLLKHIASLLKTPEKTIWISGQDVTSLKEKTRAREMAMVPQTFNIELSFSVEEIVAMGRYPYIKGLGNFTQQDKEFVQHALEKTNLLQHRTRDVNTLSGGELQRVILARAIAQQTDILLLDEPLSHLDIHHQLDILNLTKRLSTEEDKTILCVMHDLNLTMKYCDHVILLCEGEIYASGEANEVLTEENIRRVYSIDAKIVEINGNSIIIY